MGNIVGDLYDRPEKKGSSPYTRSGIPPPKLAKKHGSDEPTHRNRESMSLELHMAGKRTIHIILYKYSRISDDRVRLAGLSDAERDWRQLVLQLCFLCFLFLYVFYLKKMGKRSAFASGRAHTC